MAKPEEQPNPGEIAARANVSAAARALLQDGMTPDGYLLALKQSGLSFDALAFVASWLEKREAVWWGCQCLWHVLGEPPDPARDADLQVIVHWVLQPGEETRRQCQLVAEARSAADPFGTLALAAFGSAGSLSLPGLPEVKPPERLTASTVHAALLMAAARVDNPLRAQQQFVQLGLDIAHGKHLWS